MTKTTVSRRDSYATPTNSPEMRETHDVDLVRVQWTWDAWRTAMVRVRDLEDVHWSWPPGAPRPLIHASVLCTMLSVGDLDHDCEPSARPHRVAVCLLKSHVSTHVFEYLEQRARPLPVCRGHSPRDAAAGPDVLAAQKTG
jgi:hypothetical protein